MSITREHVADLQPGDVVELRHRLFPEITLRGPVSASGAREYDLALPPVWIRERSGDPAEDTSMWAELTVVSRAPRPLYVNHPRTKPAPGDVVRSADDDDDVVYVCASPRSECAWLLPVGDRDALLYMSRSVLPTRLRLLVDGDTGQVVQ